MPDLGFDELRELATQWMDNPRKKHLMQNLEAILTSLNESSGYFHELVESVIAFYGEPPQGVSMRDLIMSTLKHAAVVKSPDSCNAVYNGAVCGGSLVVKSVTTLGEETLLRGLPAYHEVRECDCCGMRFNFTVNRLKEMQGTGHTSKVDS